MKSRLLYLLIVCPAFAQLQHGSVGVIYYSSDKIIMAADSRIVSADGTFQADRECKVAAPDGQIIFLSTGFSRLTSDLPGVPSWNNQDEIHSAYHRVAMQYPNVDAHLRDIADDFAESISSKFDTLAKFDPMTFENGQSENGLTVGMLGGLDATKKLELYLIVVNASHNPPPARPVEWKVVPVPSCPLQKSFCAMGNVDVAVEFANEASDRAKKEAETWPTEDGDPDSSAYDVRRTMRLVDLTIQLHGMDVGGPVDAVELTRDGHVQWFARKSTCPAE